MPSREKGSATLPFSLCNQQKSASSLALIAVESFYLLFYAG